MGRENTGVGGGRGFPKHVTMLRWPREERDIGAAHGCAYMRLDGVRQGWVRDMGVEGIANTRHRCVSALDDASLHPSPKNPPADD